MTTFLDFASEWLTDWVRAPRPAGWFGRSDQLIVAPIDLGPSRGHCAYSGGVT